MKYIVKVFPNEPDVVVDDCYAEGIECSGFAIIGDNAEGSTCAIHDVSNLDLAMAIAASPELCAASIIANALNESKKVLRERRSNDKLNDLLKALSGKRDD